MLYACVAGDTLTKNDVIVGVGLGLFEEILLSQSACIATRQLTPLLYLLRLSTCTSFLSGMTVTAPVFDEVPGSYWGQHQRPEDQTHLFDSWGLSFSLLDQQSSVGWKPRFGRTLGCTCLGRDRWYRHPRLFPRPIVYDLLSRQLCLGGEKMTCLLSSLHRPGQHSKVLGIRLFRKAILFIISHWLIESGFTII